MKSLVDPMPIITCSGKNKAGKMSTEITSRGYYSTKNVYYFGLKLHVVDKIYSDILFYKETQECKKLSLFTPVKAIKGESPEITKREKVARDLFSTAVSKVRQLIESLFNWLNEKTNIQRAMKVRFTSGLLVHTMGKIAITLITLIFN